MKANYLDGLITQHSGIIYQGSETFIRQDNIHSKNRERSKLVLH